jgi:diphthamide biosynthesis protein 4
MINHYAILNLPTPSPNSAAASAEDVKQAYRLGLLTHHPDKTKAGTGTSSKPSVDAIKAAYAVLSDPKLRASYDRELLLSRGTTGSKERVFHTGEEVVDLDDLEFDEKEGMWYRPCRCGEDRGYVVTERQLEDEEMKGGREVVIGCRGCSLWIRVGFGVAEYDNPEARDTTDASTT